MRVRLLPVLLTALAVFGAGAGDLNQRSLWPSTVYGSMLIDQPQLGHVISGLVGWWPMTEGSGSTLANAAGTDWTLTLGNMEAGDWIAGPAILGGWGLNFDGIDEYAANAAVTPPTAYPATVCVWVKPAAANSCLASITDTAAQDNWISVGNDGSLKPKFNFSTAGTNRAITGTSTFTAGTWHHVCGVFASATDRRLYADGAQEGSTDTTSLAWPSSLDRTNLGSLYRSTALYYPGGLAGFRIYNRALTADEVAAIAAGN